MFKKIVVVFILSLILIPQYSSAATPSATSISPDVKSSTTQPIQSPAPVPIPTIPIPPDPKPEVKPIPIAPPPKPEPIKFALTFDDGPNPAYTSQILALLTKFGARGTFFMVGTNALQYPTTVQQVAVSGNEIAAHSMTHPSPSNVSSAELDYEITESVTILRQLSGTAIRYFRPPYGESSYIYTRRAPALEVRIMYWTVDPRDWSGISADTIAERVLDNLEPGCIVLMHDGGGNRQETVAALEIILREANARGYRSVPLSELEE